MVTQLSESQATSDIHEIYFTIPKSVLYCAEVALQMYPCLQMDKGLSAMVEDAVWAMSKALDVSNDPYPCFIFVGTGFDNDERLISGIPQSQSIRTTDETLDVVRSIRQKIEAVSPYHPNDNSVVQLALICLIYSLTYRLSPSSIGSLVIAECQCPWIVLDQKGSKLVDSFFISEAFVEKFRFKRNLREVSLKQGNERDVPTEFEL